mgnify:CR=1 FL=1
MDGMWSWVEALLVPTWKQVVWAFLLDLLLGDPRWLPHPVSGMGRAISILERPLFSLSLHPLARKLAGACLTVAVVGGSYLVTWALITAAGGPDTLAGGLLAVGLLYAALATRSLDDHIRAVHRPLVAGKLAAARRAVSLVVGRDTEELDEGEVARAAVETAAENASDGIIAPLFYAFVGGAPLAMAYKAVNTLDSMIGHKNARYLHFGMVTARLDDLWNYLPARLTAVLLAVAGWILGYPCIRARRAIMRDARKHPSPNAGYPESAMAGLLGVRLGGTNYYQGAPSRRPHLWEEGATPGAAHIQKAAVVVRLAAWLSLGLGALLSTAWALVR